MGIGDKIQPSQDKKEIEKSKEKQTYSITEPKYSLEDLIISESADFEIRRALSFKVNHHRVFHEWGLIKTHRNHNKFCLNFYGPPGTGKTMAAHAVARELNKNLLIINYAEIESKYVGDTPKNLVSVFEFARNNDLAIFFDEADALLSRRVTAMTHSTDTSVNQTRSVLLNILNDYSHPVLFATNFISNFDPAFMRRINSHIKLDLPDEIMRVKLFQKYIPESLPHNIDIITLARKYDQLSGSDISNSVLMSAFSAAEKNKIFVEMEDIESAIKSVLQSKFANQSYYTVTTREISKEEAENILGVEK